MAAPASQPLNACRAAITRHWPKELWDNAFLTLNKENGREAPGRKSDAPNYDGSIDYGCMMINNKAHPRFFATKTWDNPDDNAEYAYQIYKGRGNFSAWYAVKGILW